MTIREAREELDRLSKTHSEDDEQLIIFVPKKDVLKAIEVELGRVPEKRISDYIIQSLTDVDFLYNERDTISVLVDEIENPADDPEFDDFDDDFELVDFDEDED